MDKRKVFISYAKEDEHHARKLYDDLKRFGVDPWLDSKDLLPGQNWEAAINRAIGSSDYFIALLSKRSLNKRGFVQKELKQAFEVLRTFPAEQIYLIPARIEDCRPSDTELIKLHWVDLFDSWEQGLQQIALAMQIVYSFDQRKGELTQSSVEPQRQQQLNLDLTNEGLTQLRSLRDALGAKSDQEAIRQSLRLMQWYVEASQHGESIYVEKQTEDKLQKIKVIVPSSSSP